MLLFRDEEHIDRWCESHDMERGGTMTPAQAWRLADRWYRDKLAPDWRRFTVEEAEAILAEVGLAGDFWRLR
jgi:hypothetical protein